jgi:CRP-like cAMP-binding protein
MFTDPSSQDQSMPGRVPPTLERRQDPFELIESLGTIRSCRRGEEVYGREDPAKHLYRVVSGVARDCALRADGRRQIVAFLMPRDFFGFAARDEREFAVEAVTDGTVVACYPRQRIEMLADADPRLGRLLREMAIEAISRSQARLLILGRMTAAEKVGLFLVEMADRTSAPGAAVLLPMSRYDIADYLALSVETVCRTLTDLKHRGTITLTGTHRVKIIDRAVLCGLGSGSPPIGGRPSSAPRSKARSGVAYQGIA